MLSMVYFQLSFQYVILLNGGLTWVPIYMFVLNISKFSSYQVAGTFSVLMGNGSHASVRGVGTVDLNFTSWKTMHLKNIHHVPSINKNLVSGSLLCRDGLSWYLSPIKL